MTHQGSCHCGRIAFEVDADFAQAIECNCSHCSRKGYLFAFVPRQQLRLKTSESALSTYLFNKHVIRHHFCSDPKGNPTAAVNLRCLPDLDRSKLKIVPFDGKSR